MRVALPYPPTEAQGPSGSTKKDETRDASKDSSNEGGHADGDAWSNAEAHDKAFANLAAAEEADRQAEVESKAADELVLQTQMHEKEVVAAQAAARLLREDALASQAAVARKLAKLRKQMQRHARNQAKLQLKVSHSADAPNTAAAAMPSLPYTTASMPLTAANECSQSAADCSPADDHAQIAAAAGSREPASGLLAAEMTPEHAASSTTAKVGSANMPRSRPVGSASSDAAPAMQEPLQQQLHHHTPRSYACNPSSAPDALRPTSTPHVNSLKAEASGGAQTWVATHFRRGAPGTGSSATQAMPELATASKSARGTAAEPCAVGLLNPDSQASLPMAASAASTVSVLHDGLRAQQILQTGHASAMATTAATGRTSRPRPMGLQRRLASGARAQLASQPLSGGSAEQLPHAGSSIESLLAERFQRKGAPSTGAAEHIRSDVAGISSAAIADAEEPPGSAQVRVA